MRIAVISDVHGNLPALEAVMKDIKNRAVDKIICLGDIIGKGPSSKEVIDICRNECESIVQGNWDEALYADYISQNQGGVCENGERTRWCIESAGSDRIEYLGSLPHRAELYLSGKLVRLFHAHPQNFNRYYDDSPVEKRLELFKPYDSEIQETADVAVYGDIHHAYMQILDGRHLLNVGSVGNPLDITQASYVVLEGGETADSNFGIQFMRVSYDIEKAVSLAARAKVPDLDGYIAELRTAVYFRRS